LKNEEKGIAVIVTYNRKESLLRCINCLCNQTCELDKIYIINNASVDGTEQFLEDISKKNSKIFYRTLKENNGGSEGFYQALWWAYNDGADWIWGMDDDAYANPDSLEKLLHAKDDINDDNFCLWSNCNGDLDFDNNIKLAKTWMFVGFFITKSVIEKVGFPRNDLFIYYDDCEYASRIQNSGINIYKVRDSIIVHQDAVSNIKKFIILRKELKIILLPKQNWKVYYYVRNRILISEKKVKKLAVRKGLFHAFKCLFYNPRQFKFVILGVWHGIRGKSGKVISP